jgi:dTDP-4-dehydrorhamnose reductase
MAAPYLVLGAGGQLSSALKQQLGQQLQCAGLPELDFCRADFALQLSQLIRQVKPRAVINAAAYTQVDKAEGEGRDLSRRINAEAVGELARCCAEFDVPLVHVSTDYVFDGSGERAWSERDAPNPLNAYGAHKRQGEQLAMEAGGRCLIFRTSWLYDATGSNFFNTMLRLMAEREVVRVVADQWGAPTYVPHLAEALVQGLERALEMNDFPSGIYHLAAGGETSWHGFAEAIFMLASRMNSVQTYSLKCQQVLPIATADYPTPAARPRNSRLDCRRAHQVLGIALCDWKVGLAQCFEAKLAYARS